ncbi:MAG: hypothetical protein QM817_24835 [Archangium sp.]
MRFRSLALVFATLAGCTVSVPLEGKRCAATEPRCLPGYQCVNDFCVTDAGNEAPQDAGCAFDVDPLASACMGSDWYLAQSGDDARDGRSAANARRTLAPAMINGGDRIHLLGRWTTGPALSNLSGSASCPLIISGDADAGTVIANTIDVGGSYVVWTKLVFTPQPMQDSIHLAGNARFLTFHDDTFTGPSVPTGSYPYFIDFASGSRCDDCTVRNSSFDASEHRLADIDGTNFSFVANRVVLREGPNLQLHDDGARVEGNDFSGAFNDFALQLDGTGVVAFNVFHNVSVTFPDKRMLTAPRARVTRNTFTQISTDNDIELVQAQRFDDNLISNANNVVAGAPPPAGDWNIFAPDVARPYVASDGGVFGTDRRASVDFEAGFTPLGSNLAIDGADPSLPVPPGGGLLADVGAVERGATRTSRGSYCAADGGL